LLKHKHQKTYTVVAVVDSTHEISLKSHKDWVLVNFGQHSCQVKSRPFWSINLPLHTRWKDHVPVPCEPVCLYYYYDYYNTPLQSGTIWKQCWTEEKEIHVT
jgi:hypothetical protein